ncbi:MAG: MFS transporter [Desulfobacteraceae bacterium]|nr:MFS transporter [Desulfobacteraceae bacterium]
MTDKSSKPGPRGEKNKWMILSAVMLGVIMGPIDGSIVNVVLPTIANYFQTDYALVQWVPTIYLLAICSFILIYGRLGDMLGYKRIFLTGLVCFAGASLLCGLSRNIWMLIIFRAIQGTTVAMQMALGLAIVTSVFHPGERGKAIGIYATAIALGLMLGPVLGGIIAQYLSWRFVFYINVPIAAIALIWGGRMIPAGEKKPGQRLDLAGAALAFAYLFSIVLYANRGETLGWFSGWGLALLLSAIGLGWLFIYVERKTAQPMLNLQIFSNRRFSFACLSSLLNFMGLYTVVFLTPWFLSDALHRDVFSVGMVMMAFALLTFFVGPLSGALSDRIGYRGLGTAGMLIHAAGLVLLSRLGTGAGNLDVAWRLAVCGCGAGMFQSPINSAVMGSAPAQFRGIASSLLAVMRNTGMAFGIAVAGAVVYNLAPFTTRGYAGPFSGAHLDIFINGLHWSYLTGALFSLLSATAVLFAKAGPQRTPELSIHSSRTATTTSE